MAEPLNPYSTDRLSPQHLELLFPATFYQTDEELSRHMSESCLVEQMTWEGNTAVGETAFWLKVLSTPQSEYLKRQKRLFKLAIAERCKDISFNYSDPNANKPPAIIKLKVQNPKPTPAEDPPPKTIEIKMQKTNKQPTILFKQVNPPPTADGQPNQPIIVDQMISDNDWELIEKHLSGENATPNVPATQVSDSQLDYGSPTPGFGIKTYKCKLCPFAADNRASLNKHQKANHADQLPYSCDRCDYTSKYAWSIKTHIDSVHLKTKRFQCPDCSYATSQACFLRRHTMRVHNPNVGAHKCPYCDYSAHHPNSLQRHINRQHTKNFAHKCPYCDFGRDCKYLVEDHINDVHLKKVIYQCSECSFQTYKQRSLKSHLKTHQNRDVVQCSECDYRSVSMAGLTRHMKAEHPNSDAKATIASLKGGSFKSGIKSDGEDYTAVLMGKCKFCNFTTENVLRLKAHVRSVHKRKNIPCQYCPFKAANKKGLARHMTNKHKDKVNTVDPEAVQDNEEVNSIDVPSVSDDQVVALDAAVVSTDTTTENEPTTLDASCENQMDTEDVPAVSASSNDNEVVTFVVNTAN